MALNVVRSDVCHSLMAHVAPCRDGRGTGEGDERGGTHDDQIDVLWYPERLLS